MDYVEMDVVSLTALASNKKVMSRLKSKTNSAITNLTNLYGEVDYLINNKSDLLDDSDQTEGIRYIKDEIVSLRKKLEFLIDVADRKSNESGPDPQGTPLLDDLDKPESEEENTGDQQ